MPTLVSVSQFARFIPKMHTICSTLTVLQPNPRAMLQHAQRHLAHEICNCRKIRCTLHLASYVQGSVYIVFIIYMTMSM